jgi:uncharacterized membrane protein
MNETIHAILPSVHTLLGSTTIIGGLVALSVRKGSHLHVLGGRLFLFTMIPVGVTSVAIMMVRDFLPLAVVLSLAEVYLLPSAVLSIRRTSRHFLLWNRLLMSLAGLLLLFTIAQFIRLGFALSQFLPGPLVLAAVFGFLFVDDWIMLRSRPRPENYWIRRHFARMILGLTIAVVAFGQIGTGLAAEVLVVLPLALAALAIALFYRRYRLNS